ncbi:MAG: transporter related [Paenibacillus sp.]|nr:transporter related [Paenibacillus sp.]
MSKSKIQKGESYDREYTFRILLSRLSAYFRPHSMAISIIVAVILLNSILSTIVPVYISKGVNELTESADMNKVITIIATILIAGLLSWVCLLVRQLYTAKVLGNVVLNVRKDTFKAILKHDMSFFDEQPAGSIVSRVTSDAQGFSDSVTLTVNFISNMIMIIPLIGVLLYVNVTLGLLTLLMLPAIMIFSASFRKLSKRMTHYKQQGLANIGANIQESISCISVAKDFRQEQALLDEFKQMNQQSYAVKLKWGLVMTSNYPILEMVSNIATILVIGVGGLYVLNGNLSAGDLYLFLQAVAIFWVPFTGLAAFWNQFQAGVAAGERIFAIMDLPTQMIQVDSRPVPRLKGTIEFNNLTFQYKSEANVLENFRLHIQPGETIALVGHTGAGKSSVAKLVSRLYEYQDGQLLIDGEDIRKFDGRSYYKQLGIVPQTPVLFSGTIADNIRYGNPDASDEQIALMANRIGGGHWLNTLPDGLATRIGEMGKGVSMGQRQLIALCRVMLRDPMILILDEPTASIDPFTEAQIQQSMNELFKDRTVIVIAHRLSTIKNADRIVVLERGKMVEQGSHNELLTRGTYYSDLYNQYYRHQELAI